MAKAKSSVSIGWTDLSGNAASCAQQHLTLGWAGTFSSSHGRFGAVSWQHDAFTGAESARSCRTKILHDPGGRAKTKLVATATSWWRKTFMALDYTQDGSEKFCRMKEFCYPIAFAMTKAAASSTTLARPPGIPGAVAPSGWSTMRPIPAKVRH
jgi:hypothetical protein